EDSKEGWSMSRPYENRDRQQWALSLVRTVGLDWKHWTRDTTKLESVRRQLGEEIHRLSSQ
ncbi:hypothetical protein VF10_36390, partial [Nostoc linckia z13]